MAGGVSGGGAAVNDFVTFALDERFVGWLVGAYGAHYRLISLIKMITYKFQTQNMTKKKK